MKARVLLIVLFVATAAVYAQEPVSPLLKAAIAGKAGNEQVRVVMWTKENSLKKSPFARSEKSSLPDTRLVRIDTLNEWIRSGKFAFADLPRLAHEELTTSSNDISLNALSWVHDRIPLLQGSGTRVSIKERRFDTSDIDLRSRYFSSGVAATLATSHASIMATILAGAGNSSPFAVGAAPDALITSSDFTSLMPDADSVYGNYNIRIQNHSYGTGLENYYGADAAAYDRTAIVYPELLHVFSAGNSGTSAPITGTYVGLTGMSNITGSFKMSKNSLAVGATDSVGNIAAQSSRGPAYDGRLKPELVAFGEDGSSGAGALVSGTAAILQQAYALTHAGSLPAAALLKAILINSALDAGTPGPDYISGYGSLNAKDAVLTVNNNHFFQGAAAQNGDQTFSITIPANAARLKVTLAWSDPPALPNAAKALTNDLDLTVTENISGTIWLPWVLNPLRDSLLKPALRKIDTLNTVEQVTVDFPQPGNYTLHVKGSHVLNSSPQSFSLAYGIDTIGKIEWTYPTGSDPILANRTNILRWQTADAGLAALSYSTDGVTWTPLANVDLATKNYKWTTPDTLCVAQLKLTATGIASALSDKFIISKQPDLKVGFNCLDSFMLAWTNVAGQYQVSRLGQKSMQSFLLTTDSFRIFNKAIYPDLVYSVTPLVNGRKGFSSYAVDYSLQGVGCYIRSFFASLQNKRGLLTASVGTTVGLASVSFQKKVGGIFQTIFTSPANGLSFNFVDSSLINGANQYRLLLTLADGSTVLSNIETIYFTGDVPVLVFPNPASVNAPITIIAVEPGIYTASMYDAAGRMVNVSKLDDRIQRLEVPRLTAGMYFISIVDENGQHWSQKLLVQ